MKKLLALALTGVMCLSLLTACGNEKAPTTEETNTTVEEAADETANETTEETAEESAESEEAGTTGDVLTVGTNAEFPPFEYVDDNGEVDGFDVALIKAIGEKIGREVVMENMEFNSLIAAIGSKIDIAIAGMTIDEERKQAVNFSEPYYEAVQYVIVPEGSDIAAFADLEGKTIGVQLGTTGDIIASDDIANSNVSAYNKAVDAVNDLVNGKLDCVIIDKNPALVFEEKFEGQVVALDGAQFDFAPEFYAIAVSKEDTALLEDINAALAELIEDGTFDALVAEYIEN